jgi:hypothetical protein
MHPTLPRSIGNVAQCQRVSLRSEGRGFGSPRSEDSPYSSPPTRRPGSRLHPFERLSFEGHIILHVDGYLNTGVSIECTILTSKESISIIA